jgi:hypothetical protein
MDVRPVSRGDAADMADARNTATVPPSAAIYDPVTDSYYEGRDLTWHGTNWAAIAARLQERSEAAKGQARQHDSSASIWRRFVKPLAWLTALLAGLSGLSVVSANDTASVGLAIATAIVASTNAALDPSATERSHRTAAYAYDRLRRRVDDYAFLTIGEYEAKVPPDELTKVVGQLKEFDDEFNRISDAAPGARVEIRPDWYRQPVVE